MRAETYDATFPQRIMFLQNVMHPTDESFDGAFIFRILGDLDFDTLLQASLTVYGSSTGVNTHFINNGGRIEAVVEPQSAHVTVEPIDVGASAEDREEAWITSHTESIVRSGPISPSQSEQLRIRFYRGRHATYMTMQCAHIVGDAYTFYRLMDLVGTLYASPVGTWSDLLTGVDDHPGNVPAVRTSPSSVDAYRQLLSGIQSFEHPNLSGPRLEGKIPGRHLRRTMSQEEERRIRTSTAVEAFGAATVFFAAYAAMLHRLCPDDDVIVIGVPLANRAGYRAKRATGFFVNTLPLPLRIDDATTWWQLCEQIKAGIRLLQKNQGLNLLGPEMVTLDAKENQRTLDNAVTFYQQGLVLELAGADVTSLPLTRESLSYPLSLNVADDGTSYAFDLSVADHLTATQPEELLYAAVENIISTPQSTVVEGSVFTAEPPNECISGLPAIISGITDLVSSAGALHAGRTAIRMGSESVSYQELLDRVSAAADQLDVRQATEHVVVKAAKSIDAVIAMLAVMASGRVYVPVDPQAPAQREALILDRIAAAQNAPATVVSDGVGSSPRADEIAIGQLSRVTGTASRVATRRHRSADDTAYVIFTSGSTGEPKGVRIPHRNVIELFRSTVEPMALCATDTWCLFHSMAFDFSIWEIFGPLLTGGTLVIPTLEEIREPDSFARFLDREGVTILNQTPSAFRRLTGTLQRVACDMSAVRLLVFGGEALYPSDLQSWQAHAGETTRFINMYGITETTVHVTYKEISVEETDFEHRSVIGRPLEHLDMVAVDHYGRLCRTGMPGELLVTGRGLAQGYLGRPDLTLERFIGITSSTGAVAAYRTGDKGYRLPEGDFVYAGRVDDQVQLRGYRIELGEIEAAFAGCPQITASVVRLITREDNEPFIAAWVIGAVEGDLPEIRRLLLTRLPAYMLPPVIVCVDALPMNQNGKPDVSRLHDLLPQPSAPRSGGADQEPALGIESTIIRIWEKVLGTGRINPADRFLEVGGTSMHIMQIHALLQQELALGELSLVDLFEYATPRDLAKHLESRSKTSVTS